MNSVIAKFIISDDRIEYTASVSKGAKNVIVAFITEDDYFTPKLLKSALFRILRDGGRADLRIYCSPEVSDSIFDNEWLGGFDIRQTERPATEVISLPRFWASLSAFDRALILPRPLFIFKNPFVLPGHVVGAHPDEPALYNVADAIAVAAESPPGEFHANYRERFQPQDYPIGLGVRENSAVVRGHLAGLLMG